jgi:hypothetical protein
MLLGDLGLGEGAEERADVHDGVVVGGTGLGEPCVDAGVEFRSESGAAIDANLRVENAAYGPISLRYRINDESMSWRGRTRLGRDGNRREEIRVEDVGEGWKVERSGLGRGGFENGSSSSGHRDLLVGNIGDEAEMSSVEFARGRKTNSSLWILVEAVADRMYRK